MKIYKFRQDVNGYDKHENLIFILTQGQCWGNTS